MKSGRFPILVLAIIALSACMVLPAVAAEEKTYTVKAGDTLWSISQRFYGDRELWPALWELNRHRTTNPHQISVGDVLVIYPIERLLQQQSPPAPPDVKKSLYDRGQPLSNEYPKYFTFLADPKGIAGTGVQRIKVKKVDPLTGKTIVTYDEVRQVGEVIASTETGKELDDSRERYHGRSLLSFNDDVIIRFTTDLAKVLDSATHEDPDPYFREFPIYGLGKQVIEPDTDRHDFKNVVGSIHEFKGRLTVVSRVETLTPLTEGQEKQLATQPGLNRDSERVSYVARITYSERPINIGDMIFVFKNLYPGPDRETGGRKLHKAGQYRHTSP